MEADISDLTHYTDADIDGTETAFDNWDKDVTDDFDGAYGSLTGAPTQIGAFGGNMGGAPITNLGAPTAGTDAATLQQVLDLQATVAALQTQVNNLSDALDALTARVDAAHPPPPPAQ